MISEISINHSSPFLHYPTTNFMIMLSPQLVIFKALFDDDDDDDDDDELLLWYG